MELRIRNTGEVFHESAFRQEFRDRLIPPTLTEEWLNDFGVDVVFEGPQATPTTVYEFSYRNGVEQINGKWYTKYSLGPVFTDVEGSTAAQQQAAYEAAKDAEQATSVRASRDQLLTATDWRFRSDLTPSQEWKDYCQALRDIPSQTGFPWEITWPTQPN